MTDGRQTVISEKVLLSQAKGNIFNWSKLNNIILMIIFSAVVLWFIRHARKGKEFYLRKIAGLDAVEEAVGRATEMGKTVLFIHGLGGMGDIATIASVNILGRIARKIAAYDATLKVTNIDPIVMAVSQEIVKEAYSEGGRPDAYRQDNIFYVAAQQFSYAAAVDGLMMRERPAATFFLGTFMAEALLLSETGAMTNAIQIAGTDSYSQLPFFVTTCDYTLIGEELYAASAYLSREPKLVGSLKGQDIGKSFIILVLIIGTLLVTVFQWHFIPNLLKALG
jgi:hypothetical protein